MKIIINVSNLVMGGAKQVAQSILHEISKRNEDIQYHVFLSIQIQEELNNINFPSNFTFYLIKNKPQPFFLGKAARKELEKLENQIQPNFVLSIFGPVYWSPKTFHVCGFADGWVINPESIAYKKLTPTQWIKMKLINWVKKYYLNTAKVDKYIVETDVVRYKLSLHTNINISQIYVVSNTFGDQYNASEIPSISFIDKLI